MYKTIKTTLLGQGRSRRIFLAIFSVLFVAVTVAPPVAADNFDEQIKVLQSQADQYQAQAGGLRAQADTLQNTIAALQAQSAALQRQIDINNARQQQLARQIVETQQKLDAEKGILGDNLRSMYLENQVTPLEMIASSKSISDFIDKQEYRNKLRDQVSHTITTVKQTQIDLSDQKKKLDQVIADEDAQKSQLAQQQNEQSQLLARTQGQEAAYQQLVSQSNASIASLREQQAAANRAALGGSVVPGDASHGGYPNKWNDAPLDAYLDNWGMYSRECVSFTAFKVANSGRYMPYGLGNANQWPANARAAGVDTGSTPKAGAVAISMSGYYGHAMYVLAVLNGGSQIYVSQYNYDYGSGPGRYSEMTVSSVGLTYIYF